MIKSYALPGTGLRPALQMASGLIIDIESPDPETILPEDIAGSLAYICRFGGHTSEFFSVAQHSLLVADIAIDLAKRENTKISKKKINEFYLYGLLHDASEGILGCDIPTPLKRYPGLETFKVLQDIHMAAIAKKFNLPIGFDKRQILKRADVIAFAIEARDLMVANEAWYDVESTERDRYGKLEILNPEAAKSLFLKTLLFCLEKQKSFNAE